MRTWWRSNFEIFGDTEVAQSAHYAALLMRVVKQHELMQEEQTQNCMRVEFVRAKQREDEGE